MKLVTSFSISFLFGSRRPGETVVEGGGSVRYTATIFNGFKRCLFMPVFFRGKGGEGGGLLQRSRKTRRELTNRLPSAVFLDTRDADL